ncbi:DUF2958 domain-containing protein [Burkholderia cepacia]|uniref:DUF2958 domain-containing protein n=1 Tax=Burkholderia cepacia TaxID=292 RepID=UPI002EDB35BC
MSQLSFSSFDTTLMVRDTQGRYLPATVDQILEAARQVVERKMQRGASFTSPAVVKEYLCAKLAGYEHEVFSVLFLDSQHRLGLPIERDLHFRAEKRLSAYAPAGRTNPALVPLTADVPEWRQARSVREGTGNPSRGVIRQSWKLAYCKSTHQPDTRRNSRWEGIGCCSRRTANSGGRRPDA